MTSTFIADTGREVKTFQIKMRDAKAIELDAQVVPTLRADVLNVQREKW